MSAGATMVSAETQTESSQPRRPPSINKPSTKFYVGDSSSDDDNDSGLTASVDVENFGEKIWNVKNV